MSSISFVEKRKKVMSYITDQIEKQGEPRIAAVGLASRISFWEQKDVENLYNCINSKLPANVINAIVAHDYNGLANKDEFFVPQSSQFGSSDPDLTEGGSSTIIEGVGV